MGVTSPFAVMYVLLTGVVVAILLSLMQLRRDPQRLRVFVPTPRVLWCPAQTMDSLLYSLTKGYHVLGLYLCLDASDPDALFCTVRFNQPTPVAWGTRLWTVDASDFLTVPGNLVDRLPSVQGSETWWWKLHPFPRSRRQSRIEKAEIYRQWSRVKQCRVVKNFFLPWVN